MWGSRSAPVTLVLFSDFQCPFCSRVEQTITQLREKYGPDKLRIVWKNNPLPFHPNAKPAAIASEAVFRLGGSKAFWKFHDTAFANQKDLSADKYEQWAVEAGVDKAKFKDLIAKNELAVKVDADTAVGKSVGVQGTPAAFINGVFLSGAQPMEKFTSIIDEQMSAAKAAIASGTKPDKVYAKLAGENKSKSPPPDKKDREKGEKKDEDDKSVWKVPVGDSAVRGNPHALVTIVEFSDFQCPFCGRVEPTLTEVEKTYGDKVRLVWKHNPLPFHNRAEPAAELSVEARAEKGDKGFWAAHDLLFKKECVGNPSAKDKQACDADKNNRWVDNQSKLNDEDLFGYAKELGLDEAKVKAAITDDKHQVQISTDQELGEDLNAGGTPHFFVNGRRLVGAQPIEKFKSLIDEELKKAEAMVAKGVAAKDVYSEIMKDGKEPPPPERKTVDAPAKESPSKGSERAKVVMEIFSDFQCPYCKRVEDTLKQVDKNYSDKIRVVWRHKPLPMHKDAPLAGRSRPGDLQAEGQHGVLEVPRRSV